MLLDVIELTKTYRGGVRANDGITVQVGAGEVFGLLGPNGAGKTTLVHQVLGQLVPDSGSIRIDGDDVVSKPALARELCSFQPQAAAPVEGLSPRQAIDIVGRIRGGSKEEVRRRGTVLLDALDMSSIADRPVPLSGGMARLTGFCMAAVVPGRLVILDEPTNDVDPLRRRALWQLIQQLANDGAAVLLVTHNVLEAERCVDRLAIIGDGRLLAEGTPASLKSNLGAPLRLECTLEGTETPDLPPWLTLVAANGRRLIAHVQISDVNATMSWATAAQDDRVLAEFALTPASLEDVYAAWIKTEGVAA